MFFSIFIIVQSSLLSNFRTFSSTIISHFQFSLPLPPPPSQTSWQPLIYFLFLWICLFWTLQMNAAAAAKSFQSCPTLWDPIDGSPTGSPVPGILQARILEWVAISFSNAWKWKVKVKSLSRVWLFKIPWTAAYQAPPSVRFSWQENWSGLPLLSDE